jgi:hypothetical protein
MMKTENFKKTTEQPDFERGHEILEQEESHGARSGCSGTLLYFAYGSNMNLNQMAFRCPDAEVVDTVRLEGYRLAFRTNGGGNGVATILPEPDSFVDGVLWRISERDEQHLDHYEGFPFLYGKEPVTVTDQDGVRREIMAYTMNSPYKEVPAMPSKAYLEGILNGCRQNGIETASVLEAVWLTQRELPEKIVPHKKQRRQKNGEER